jgi:hypothetical protein
MSYSAYQASPDSPLVGEMAIALIVFFRGRTCKSEGGQHQIQLPAARGGSSASGTTAAALHQAPVGRPESSVTTAVKNVPSSQSHLQNSGSLTIQEGANAALDGTASVAEVNSSSTYPSSKVAGSSCHQHPTPSTSAGPGAAATHVPKMGHASSACERIRGARGCKHVVAPVSCPGSFRKGGAWSTGDPKTPRSPVAVFGTEKVGPDRVAKVSVCDRGQPDAPDLCLMAS